MATLSIRNSANTAWSPSGGVSGIKVRDSTNSSWIDKAGLSGVSVRDATNSSWLTFAAAPLVVTQLQLDINDLDFVYRAGAVSNPSGFADFRVTLNTASYFSNGAWHIALPVDAEGSSGANNPHCGPIIRRTESLWSTGRGWIIFSDGSVAAEQWNGTLSPVVEFVTNTSPGVFNPATTPVFTVRIRAGYRTGTLAETMLIDIYAGSDYSAKIFSASKSWGWDRPTSYRAAIAGIGYNFVKPADTGCVEQTVPRAAQNAILPFTDVYYSIN